MELYTLSIHYLYYLYRSDILLQQLGGSPLVALKGKLHALGGERFAVVKLDSGTKFELVDQLLATLRLGFGHARRHAPLGHRLKKHIMQAILHHFRGDEAGIQAGIKPGRGQRHTHCRGEFPLGPGGRLALTAQAHCSLPAQRRRSRDVR
jgi:hypothetical protein